MEGADESTELWRYQVAPPCVGSAMVYVFGGNHQVGTSCWCHANEKFKLTMTDPYCI